MSASSAVFVALLDDMIQEVREQRHSLKEKKARLEHMREDYLQAATTEATPSSSATVVNGKKEKKRKLEESSVADTLAPSTPSTPAPAEKKQKKIKKVKDPNMPKRAMSAYMLWYQDASKEYKEKHPEVSTKEIMKTVGAEWKTLSEEVKAPWEKKAATAKIVATEAMSAYKNSAGGAAAAPEAAADSDDDSD